MPTSKVLSNTFWPMESWITKRRRTQKGTAPNKPIVVMVLEPNLSEMPPKTGEKSAGMTREMKIKPAPVDVQWNVSFTYSGSTLSSDAREVDSTKQPNIATSTRGTRKSVTSGGMRWVHFGRGFMDAFSDSEIDRKSVV